METLKIIQFYAIDIAILMVPILFIIIATIKSASTKFVIAYGAVLSVITGVIIQYRYPGHTHVPGSDIIFVAIVLIICFCVIAISIILRSILRNDKNT